MPIIRKDGKRSYFVHIPKSAGTSLYLAFLESHYQIANYGGFAKAMKAEGVAGLAREVLDRYQIRSFQREGDLEIVQSSMQHATADIWSKWGPFDSSFAVLRNPMNRFFSALSYRYQVVLYKNKLEHSPQLFERFSNEMRCFFQAQLPKKSTAFDNHFRKATDFLLPQTKLYLLEFGGMDELIEDFGLGEIPHKNKTSEKLTFGDEFRAFAEDYYAEDIEFYDTVCRERGHVKNA